MDQPASASGAVRWATQPQPATGRGRLAAGGDSTMSHSQKGFTLIEVMVAIMLMAVVSLMAWRGLDSVTRADSHLQASTEQTETLLRALNQLERDVALRA